MYTNDATGNPVQLHQYYGYTQSQNGITRTIIGRCKAIQAGKITLDNLKETTYVYIHEGTQSGRVSHPERARTVSSVTCFPIDINNLKTP